MFQAAEFLKYGATEEQLIERVVMNLHPDILNNAAFLEKPRTRRELYRVIGLLEERFSVQEERERLGRIGNRASEGLSSPGDFPHSPRRKPRGPGQGQIRCWDCGQMGHVRSGCPAQNTSSGNGPRPGARAVPGGVS